MDKWEYQVLLVNKWGKAVRVKPRGEAEAWQFDDRESSDLVTLLQEIGSDGWELVGIDTNVSYAQGPHSYIGSLYIFQRDYQ